MGAMQANSTLDAFIKNTLKSSDTNLQPVNWSEVEVLLRHEQKTIWNDATKKKIVLIMIVAAATVLFLFGIISIVRHYSSLPDENISLTDSVQNTFVLMDTSKTDTIGSRQHKTDSIKIDSASFAGNKQAPDSIPNISQKTISDTQSSPDIKAIRNQDKQQKIKNPKISSSTGDSSIHKKDSVKTPSKDSVSNSILKEIKNETLLPSDTAIKKSAPAKNTSKNKKTKSKKSASAQDTSLLKIEPPLPKPDSLIQQ